MPVDPLGTIRTDLNQPIEIMPTQEQAAIRCTRKNNDESDVAILLDMLGLDPQDGAQ